MDFVEFPQLMASALRIRHLNAQGGDGVRSLIYLREPRWGFFRFDCRLLVFLRVGLLITKVPLPRYSAV